MTRDELLAALRAINERSSIDPERDHADADDLLLDFIADEEIRDAWDGVEKWYA